jgi:Rap1a immunity proteins
VAARLAFVVVILALALWPRAARAYDGNELLRMCNDPNPTNSGFCLGYTNGVSDTLETFNVACLSLGVTTGQVRDIVIKYLRDHPDQRHHNADFLATRALLVAFPCEDKK